MLTHCRKLLPSGTWRRCARRCAAAGLFCMASATALRAELPVQWTEMFHKRPQMSPAGMPQWGYHGTAWRPWNPGEFDATGVLVPQPAAPNAGPWGAVPDSFVAPAPIHTSPYPRGIPPAYSAAPEFSAAPRRGMNQPVMPQSPIQPSAPVMPSAPPPASSRVPPSVAPSAPPVTPRMSTPMPATTSTGRSAAESWFARVSSASSRGTGPSLGSNAPIVESRRTDATSHELAATRTASEGEPQTQPSGKAEVVRIDADSSTTTAKPAGAPPLVKSYAGSRLVDRRPSAPRVQTAAATSDADGLWPRSTATTPDFGDGTSSRNAIQPAGGDSKSPDGADLWPR